MEQIRVATFAGPGAQPVIRTIPWPNIPKKAALIKIGACGVCGTDLHILKGHWPKKLPWPFTVSAAFAGSAQARTSPVEIINQHIVEVRRCMTTSPLVLHRSPGHRVEALVRATESFWPEAPPADGASGNDARNDHQPTLIRPSC